MARFEKTLLEVLIQHPDLISPSDFDELLESEFTVPSYAEIISSIRQSKPSRLEPSWLNELAQSLSPELHPTLRALAAVSLPASDEEELKKYVQGVVVSGFISILTRQKLSLQAALRQLDPSDVEGIGRLQRELVAIEERRRNLQGG